MRGERIAVLASIDRGSGPAVLLLHGQPGTGASWDAVTDLLAGECRVLAPDRIGYGHTGGRAQGLAGNADLLASFLSQRRAGPATVVAHSWAGGAAVLLAHRYPELVDSLVLVGAACTPDSLNFIDRWLVVPVLGEVMTAAGLIGIGNVLPRLRRLTRYAPAQYRDRLDSALPSRDVAGIRPGSLRGDTRTFMIEQRAIEAELPAVAEALGVLDLPVAVVSGTWDLVVPPRAAVSLVRAIPGAELTLLPRTGHFVARDSPVALADVVRRAVRAGTDVTDREGWGRTPEVG
jgi:pimeloyl-ACP methyl ester carboxylesterase